MSRFVRVYLADSVSWPADWSSAGMCVENVVANAQRGFVSSNASVDSFCIFSVEEIKRCERLEKQRIK